MNSMISAKYKIHRFINLAFYFVFFLIGYLIGNGFNLSSIREVFIKFFL